MGCGISSFLQAQMQDLRLKWGILNGKAKNKTTARSHGLSTCRGTHDLFNREGIAKPPYFRRNRDNRDQPCRMAGLLLCIVEEEWFAGLKRPACFFHPE
jgi:hypothetical protein